VDEAGRIVLPPDLAADLGIAPGARVFLRPERDGVRIGRAASSLARIYLEPTTACNLDCRMCMHSRWDEPGGTMSGDTFGRVLDASRRLPRPPVLFFGGYGEPLLHPDIYRWIAAARGAGLPVEMITNGTLLDEAACARLIALDLDRLWISIDGTGDDPAGATGGGPERVTENVGRLFQARERALADLPRIGISFVATRQTISRLPEVLRQGKRLGADRFIVSNVLAHSPEMREQSLYGKSFYEADVEPSEWTPLVELPRMEMDGLAHGPLSEVLRGLFTVRIAGQDLHQGSSRCPFVEKGSTAVRWDGAVSPCLPLLHSHPSWLADRERACRAYTVGRLSERDLLATWDDPSYAALRERLLAFDFPPCTHCNSCEMADSNETDCFDNPLPACGGCLWAQGFIQCP
jgi:MoaA/NifB/PqqE/SkfB family radical SAM enzyme